jgi:hypothetical protein
LFEGRMPPDELLSQLSFTSARAAHVESISAPSQSAGMKVRAQRSDANHFDRLYGTEMKRSQLCILGTAVPMLVVDIIVLVVSISSEQHPAWRKMTPCTFQTDEVTNELTSVSSAVTLIQLVLRVVPALVLIAVIGRNAHRSVLDQPLEFPRRVVVGSWLWSTVVVLLIFSTVNVKELTDYEILSRRSCEVMLEPQPITLTLNQPSQAL